MQCSFEKYQVADLCLRSATTTHETLLLQKFYNEDDEIQSFCDLLVYWYIYADILSK